MSLEYIQAESARFERTEGGFLSLRLGRKNPYPRVHLYRIFPLSEPRGLISVRDEEDEEIGVIESLDHFPRETVRILEEALERRYFSPVITRLISLKDEFGYTYWDAETDAGVCRFTVKGGGSNMFHISANTLLVIDVDGNRFTYPDFEKTDSKFLKIIDTML
ncbi:MAG: DUF1854 domain-containing protein [Spirochaetales bacterium]|nr:DUF1854 domain-containing protein [Spirochaetales bacterium]